MKIGILETGKVRAEHRSRHGDYPAMFVRLLGPVDPELEFETVRVVAGEMPGHPGEADAWLVTGSRHGVYDDLPWIEPLKAFLRAAVAARVPVVGICFGHQILAEALGGRAAKSGRGWGAGVHDYEIVARPGWLAELPDPFSVRALHQDQVEALAPGATLLARSAHCPFAAIAYGDPEYPEALSLQPHPEFDAEYFADLIEQQSRTVLPADVAARARAELDRPADSAIWARLIVDYLRRATGARRAA